MTSSFVPLTMDCVYKPATSLVSCQSSISDSSRRIFIMKVMLVLALVACAAAMPSPHPGFVYSYGHPYVHSSYPVVNSAKAHTPASTVPLVYPYGHNLPQTYTYPHTFPYTFPNTFPYSFPYTYPFMVKADEAVEEEPMAEEEAAGMEELMAEELMAEEESG
nr:uncharacterized protein LOC113816218 [Penaeus vannamei]